jgi:hypothetical protein
MTGDISTNINKYKNKSMNKEKITEENVLNRKKGHKLGHEKINTG